MQRSLVAFALAAVLAPACAYHSPNAPDPEPVVIDTAAASIRTFASTRSDQRLDIAAEVLTRAGKPVVGYSVTFSLSAGTLQSSTATTGDDGIARTIAMATGSVSLTASANCSGCTETVKVLGTASSPSLAPLSVTLTGSSSSSTDVAVTFGASLSDPKATITRWTFGDGDVSTSAASLVSHRYVRAGSYTVTVTIADANGRTASDTRSVVIFDVISSTPSPTPSTTPQAITATIIAPSPIYSGTSVVLGLGLSNPSGVGTTITGWNFGDGSTSSSSSAAVAHTYASPGTYSASVSITDSIGRTAVGRGDVVVTAPLPTVSVTAGSTVISPGDTATLTATLTGTGTTITNWDFGDGSSSTSSATTLTHTYGIGGNFVVTVNARDSFGRTTTGYVYVTVTGLVVNVTCTNPTSITRNCTATITRNNVAVASSDISNAVWKWGDGTQTTTSGSGVLTSSHQYSTTGNFTITVSITLNTGEIASKSIAVTVG